MYKCAITSVHLFLILSPVACYPHSIIRWCSSPIKLPPYHPSRLIGNLAALVGVVLVAGLLTDYAAGWFDYRPMVFCTMLRPVIAVAYAVGVMVTAIGVIIWAVSMGKSEAGIGLALGGVLLFALPLVLPRYLGAECIPPALKIGAGRSAPVTGESPRTPICASP